ncbi:hypothetical protein [Couchioplanes caeruleus]|uniref:Uncharacterized protein n=2 Tax=Couchioplanes caeruleus TaxID=56438 RepID=A0A1K0FQ25_9ACTN|nr:hypothetical protein [Couchioplanes caeruleus]OJF14943.1 hypothetical protein BG844_07035 [Couchioplanes caeruleus subsp. caeruleus]ROP30452.1 hypothetical protein EDD30_3303 [Couchioplanes caeruleus]
MTVISQAYPLWCATQDGSDVRAGRVFAWMSDQPSPEVLAAEKIADAAAASGADGRFSPLVTWDPPRGGLVAGGLVRCGKNESGQFVPLHFGSTREEAIAAVNQHKPPRPS